MPKGPNGQKRPADVIGTAVMVGKLATGEESDAGAKEPCKPKSGLAGAEARAEKLTGDERSKIAKRAAEARWRK